MTGGYRPQNLFGQSKNSFLQDYSFLLGFVLLQIHDVYFVNNVTNVVDDFSGCFRSVIFRTIEVRRRQTCAIRCPLEFLYMDNRCPPRQTYLNCFLRWVSGEGRWYEPLFIIFNYRSNTSSYTTLLVLESRLSVDSNTLKFSFFVTRDRATYS
jgi:hypothetical protein